VDSTDERRGNYFGVLGHAILPIQQCYARRHGDLRHARSVQPTPSGGRGRYLLHQSFDYRRGNFGYHFHLGSKHELLAGDHAAESDARNSHWRTDCRESDLIDRNPNGFFDTQRPAPLYFGQYRRRRSRSPERADNSISSFKQAIS